MRPFDTDRWVGVDGVALVFGAVGVLAGRPPLVLCAAVALAFVAYARADRAPAPTLDVERELSSETPEPGEDVTVTVRVRNVGDAPLSDVRVLDGVPAALEADGPARLGTALRPGASAVFSYDVTAVRGEHEWGPVQVILRGPAGATERAESVECETVLRCTPTLQSTAWLPLRGLTTQYAGRVETDVPGAGLEFYSTREYRPGDPLSRIDWNRYARVGELSTVQFREERAANVVLLVDSREEAYVAADPGDPNAVERSVDAATRAFTALLGNGDRVGLATFGPARCWLPPGSGSDHRARARDLFATHPGLAAVPAEGRFFPTVELRRLRRRLPVDAQVLLFSPLVDDFAVTLARRLDAHGHLVTVVSPDATTHDTRGRRLAHAERRTRITRLRRAGVRVVDWGERSLASELERASARWSG